MGEHTAEFDHTAGPRIGELFAGYGGLGMGVEAVFGGKVAWYSDVCKFDKNGNAGHYEPHRGPCRILAHRFPEATALGDVTKIDWSTVEPVDILTGGSPCQDLSAAGKRAGMTEGTRSNLWVAMREAIAQLRPSIVVWENVRGAYSAGADSALEHDARLLADVRRRDGEPVLRALGRVLGDLSDLGYDARWHGLRAADVGAPHPRFRVFVVATDTEGRSESIIQACHDRDRSLDGTESGAGGRVGAGDPASGVRELGRGARVLPTPCTSDANGAGAHGDGGVDLRTAVNLLGTPTARMWKGSGPVGSDSHSWLLEHGNVEAQVLLLPTPAVNDMGEGKTVERWDEWTADMQAKHGNGNGHGKSLAIEAQRLLPTPRAGDGEKGGPNQRGSSGDLMLPSAVAQLPQDSHPLSQSSGDRGGVVPALANTGRLLPTPMVGSSSEASHGQISGQWREQMSEALDRWGDYAAAIARWEALLGRPAPSPTQPSSKGNDQLAPVFVEWMMGLPEGWITDVPGITRNEALKALGNGVVPQQAAAALIEMFSWDVAS